MSTYDYKGRPFRLADHGIESLLASIHTARHRPTCQCRRPGVPMYVARIGAKHYLKRMPNTGSRHAPSCESYEPPAELSGLGEVSGGAIQENVDDGVTSLRLGFSLSKAPARAAPAPTGAEADSVKTDGKKLTLRATLHYLWDQAGFHRWTPAMRGKRSWPTIRKFLTAAAQDKRAKGGAFDDLLFIPETFDVEHKEDIARRRRTKLAPLMQVTKGTRKLMIVIGEVKEFGDARYGSKVTLKHLPDYPFMLASDITSRMTKRFAREIELRNAVDDSHLILIATFGVSQTGYATVEEAALMTVNGQWLPFESKDEHDMLEKLVRADRAFMKGLRYNLASDRPLASAVLSDTEPHPVAMYIVPADAPATYTDALADLVRTSSMPAWFFYPAQDDMPALPVQQGFAGMQLHLAAAAPADDDHAHGPSHDDGEE